MPTMSTDFEVYCSCGAGLCNQTTVTDGRYGPRVTVEPCAQCLEHAKDKAEAEAEARIEELQNKIEELETKDDE